MIPGWSRRPSLVIPAQYRCSVKFMFYPIVITEQQNIRYPPHLLLGGILLFLSVSILPMQCPGEVSKNNLTEELFAEGNFEACIQECSRMLMTDKENETALLLRTLSELRTGKDSTAILKGIAESSRYSTITINTARYELARTLRKAGKTKESLEQFKKVFISQNLGDLFLHSGCSIAILIKQHPELDDQTRDIKKQMNACSALWTRRIFDDCRIPPAGAKNALTGKPVQWLITFYRSQIGPAIGQRCSLVPSCSEYAMQSLRKHGLLGVALIGDRIVREPDVVTEMPAPARIGNRWFYTDTVSEHDWWMMPNPEREASK